MLGEKEPIATIPVKDIEVAKRFYEETLGFSPAHREGEGGLVYDSGSAKILVYQSEYAGTNKATAVTWNVGDELEDLVRDLKNKGATFRRYDLPGTTHKGDIHVAGSRKLAWIEDPDGNILALASG